MPELTVEMDQTAPTGVRLIRGLHCWTVCLHLSVSVSLFERLQQYEPHRKKTGLRGFRRGLTQTGLYSYRRWLEAGNFGFRK